MRVFQNYSFLIKTKIPFSQWHEIAYAFMKNCGVKNNKFQYYFEDLDHTESFKNYLKKCEDGSIHVSEFRIDEAKRYLRSKLSFEKALADCPSLGPVYRTKQENADFDCIHLSNFQSENGATEEEVISLMSKIYRYYGFSESHIIFQDIDFFGKCVPFVFEKDIHGNYLNYGSSVILYRDRVFPHWSGITFRIEVLHDGQYYDPTPYLEEAKKLLPKIRPDSFMTYYLSPEEKEMYKGLEQTAKPLVKEVKDFALARLPEFNEPQETENFSFAPILKKTAKKYGFKYVQYLYYCYFVQKRTQNGHFISVCFDTNIHEGSINGGMIDLKGLGFELRLFNAKCYIYNSKTAERHLEALFRILCEAEEHDTFKELDNHFPTTPDWYTVTY